MTSITRDGPKSPSPRKVEAPVASALRKLQAPSTDSRAREPLSRFADRFTQNGAALQRNAVALGSASPVSQAAPVGAASGSTSVEALTAATQRVQDVDAQLNALNEQLGTELAGLGAALNDTQRAAYTEEFKKKHGYADLETQKAEAVSALAAEVQKPGVKEQLGNVTTAAYANNAITGALNTLAQTSEAAVAVKVAGELVNTPMAVPTGFYYDSQLKPWGEANAGALTSLLDTAAANVYSAQLVAAQGDPNAAASAFKATFGPFSSRPEVQKSFEMLDQMSTRDDHGAIDVLEQSLSSTSEGFGAVGFMMASAKLSLGGLNLTSGVKSTEFARLTSLFESGRAPPGLGAKLLGGVGNALKIPGADKLAARLVPAAGALYSATSAMQRLAQDDQNLGTWVGFAGDVLGAVGGGLSATVLGAPLGFVLSGVGAFISFVGDKIEGWINHDELVNARKENLEALANRGLLDRDLIPRYAESAELLGELAQGGMSNTDIEYLVKNFPGDPSSLNVDAHALQVAMASTGDTVAGYDGLDDVGLGLSPRQVVDLANKGYGAIFKDATNTQVLQDITRKFDLSPDELIRFIDAGANQFPGGDADSRLDSLLNLFPGDLGMDVGSTINNEDPRAWVELLRSRGFENAARFLETLPR